MNMEQENKSDDSNPSPQQHNLPATPQWAEEEDTPTDRSRLMFFGTNLAKIPCFKSSFMNGIGAGMVVGLVYNLATSRPPMGMAFGSYTVVLFGSWFYCRANLRIRKFLICLSKQLVYKVNWRPQ